MRKLLIGLLLILLAALLIAMAVTGIKVGDINLGYSVQAIIDKNAELDNSITNLNRKIEQEYQIAKSNLDASFKRLQKEKQTYQDTIRITSEADLTAAQQTEEYKLGYLWTKIGLYATNNNLVLKADVTNGTSGISNQYNINFTAMGSYIGISDFIYDIEKDSALGFRIEEFSVIPYAEIKNDAGDTIDLGLQATFIIKNIAIDPNSLSESANVQSGSVTTNTEVHQEGPSSATTNNMTVIKEDE